MGDTTSTQDPTQGTTQGLTTNPTATGAQTESTGEPTDTPDVLEGLAGTVWHGEQSRDGVIKAYELEFDESDDLWAEIRNPYGPARRREMRVVVPISGGDVTTTIVSPQGWPIHPNNGDVVDYSLEVVDGDPRVLRVTRDGVTEEFVEGPYAPPDSGLTAIVRVFEVGGTIDEAFCDSGAGGFEYPAIFNFANGNSDEIVATDVVAGSHLVTWPGSGANDFSVIDVDGFERLGGTELGDTFNFFVTYVGTVDHPGGELSMREGNDAVEDGLWVFLADAVGSTNVGQLFLEVHGFIWADSTPDEPSTNLAAGNVPIQAILVRCTEAIVDVDVEISLGGGGFQLLGEVDSTPQVDDELFPPAF